MIEPYDRAAGLVADEHFDREAPRSDFLGQVSSTRLPRNLLLVSG